MNTSYVIKQQVYRFLQIHYEAGTSETKINLLTLYEEYLVFVRENATGYNMSILDFSKMIPEVFPAAVLNDDKSISGISVKTYKPAAPRVIDFLGNNIIRRLNWRIKNSIKSSFSAVDLAGSNSSIDNETLDVEQIEKWLQASPIFFYNPHKNLWLRGD